MRLRWTPRPKTPDEILQAGQDAGRVLSSTAFTVAYRSVFRQYQDEIAGTALEDVEAREHLYRKIQVLSDVALELWAMYELAQAAGEARLREEEENLQAEATARGL